MSHAVKKQKDTAPSTPKYKEDLAPTAPDPHRSLPSQQGHSPVQHPSSQPLRPGVVPNSRPETSQQAQLAQANPHSHYPSPHLLNHPLPPQHHSPYVAVPQPPGQPPQGGSYYSTHPSPFAANTATGSYSTAQTPPLEMAAAHTMSRAQFPPVFHTPTSNSAASVQPPHHDQHGRPLYPQQSPQMPPNMYYPYAMTQAPSYAQHPAAPQPLVSSSIPMAHIPAHQVPHPGSHPSTPAMNSSSRTKVAPAPLQRPSTAMTPTQQTPTGAPSSASSVQSGTPGSLAINPNAAPGPIPATTPLVVRQDQNGVQWIAFEYSRDRVKMEYTIRCDVESVNVEELPQDFKTENCVYPRACCNKDQYKGNRLHYETECNTVGWALAQLNPPLRGKRGLIQRAVDSWRNSNQDPRLRSRRVRRMAKMTNRKAAQTTQQQHSLLAGPSGSTAAAAPGSAGLAAASGSRHPSISAAGSQVHHHLSHPEGSANGGGDDVSASNQYRDGSHHHHHQAPAAPNAASSSEVRHAQSFYPTYPTSHNIGNGLASAMNDGMGRVGGQAPPHATKAATSTSTPALKSDEDQDHKISLFGDLSEAKRRKFILVDDNQRNTRVRVRVTLDNVHLEEMPDAYRRSNSVYPRSFFPMQMQSPPPSPRGRRYFGDDEDEERNIKEESRAGAEAGLSVGHTLVPVPLMNGSEAEVPLPRMNKTRRSKEVALNDLGYRMSWSQSRVFSGRHLFLQRSLDAYRNKMRSTLTAAGQDVASVAPHFETRVGKRRWLERSNTKPKRESPS